MNNGIRALSGVRTFAVVVGVALSSMLVGVGIGQPWYVTRSNCITMKSNMSTVPGAVSLPTRTLRYFPQAKQCPTEWMQHYTQLHSDVLSGKRPPQHFVSVAVESGLADRLTGLVTQLWHAVLTDRALTTLTYGSVPGFQGACDSPFINWTYPPSGVPEEVIEPLKYTYKGKKYYPGDLRSLPNGTDPAQYQMWYVADMQDRVGAYINMSLSELHTPKPVFLLGASNRGASFALARNSKYKHKFWDFGITPMNAFLCGFFFLCSPSAAVEQYYKKYWDVLLDGSTLKIGIQIRTGDHVFASGEQHRQEEEILKSGAAWFQCAESLEKAFAAPGQRVLWFLNSDSKELRKAATTKFGSKLLTDDDLVVVHTDCVQNARMGQAACEQHTMDSAMQHSLGAMLTSSLADYHVISRFSGFGRLGAWLSGRWDNIYEVEPGEVCVAGKPTDPQVSALRPAGV